MHIKVICPEGQDHQERVVKDLTNAGWTFEGYGLAGLLDEDVMQEDLSAVSCVEMVFRREIQNE